MNRICLLCLLVASLLLYGCGEDKKEETKNQQQKASPTPPPLIQVVAVETAKQKIRPQFEFPVSIEAVEMSAMTPQVTGVVKQKHFSAGQLVTKGDLLMELDDADYQVKIAEISAGIDQAKANAAAATANFERAEKLKPKGYISLQDYDAAKAKNISAQSLVAQLNAQLERAKLNLNYTKIIAPFSGKVSSAHVGVGDFVSPASPTPLFELVQLDPIYGTAKVDMKVYERFVLKRIDIKEEGREIPELEFGLRLSTGQEYPHKGVFENWDNTATGTGTIAGRVVFPNPDGLLLPGQNLTLTGRVSDTLEQIIVPQKAVSQDQQGHYVWTIDDEDTVQRRNIETGIRHESNWTVAKGLEPGDRVIVEGLQKIRPGVKVQAKMLSPTN